MDIFLQILAVIASGGILLALIVGGNLIADAIEKAAEKRRDAKKQTPDQPL